MPHSISRRTVLRSMGSTLAVGLAGCLNNSPPMSRTVEMTDNLTYEPESVSIAQGGTVTWENVGSADHTVTAYQNEIPNDATYFASGGFNSEQEARQDISGGLLGASETYEHTFKVPGSYEYYCIPHESSGMIGTVRVG